MKTILIITDNKAGHESVSSGLVSQLERYMEIKVIKLSVNFKYNISKFILKILLNNNFFIKHISFKLIKFFYSFSNENINYSKIDLIVSTGGKTSFINIMLAKLYGIKNIYCSSLRGLNPLLFTYLVTINKKDLYPNALYFELAPLKIKYDKSKTSDFLEKFDFKNQIIWSILIGGATKEYPFTDKELLELIEKLLQKAKLENKKVLLTTSRRTSKTVEKGVEAFKNKYDNLAYCVLFNKFPEKIISIYLKVSDLVFITEDSGSMITESIYALKPAITIRPNSNKPQRIYQQFIQNNIRKKYLYSYSIDEIDNIDINNLNFNIYNNEQDKSNLHKIVNLLKV